MISTLQLSKPGPLNETIVGGPLGLMIPAEILPASLRAGGLALTSLVDDVTAHGALQSMPYLYSVNGLAPAVFAGGAVATALAVQDHLPATAGRSLEEVW